MSTPQPPTNIDLLVAITRVEGKVDTLVNVAKDHETRLRSAESNRIPWHLVSTLTACGALGTSIFMR